MHVGGADRWLNVVVKDGKSIAEIPVPSAQDTVQLGSDGTSLVRLDGISHLVLASGSPDAKKILGIDDLSERKMFAQDLLVRKNLIDVPTCGVIALSEMGGKRSIFPYIHSNTLDDWYAETACGSGSLAVALVEVKQHQMAIDNLCLQQPSGHDLFVSVDLKNNCFCSASVGGKVDLLYEGNFSASVRPLLSANGKGVHKFSR